MRAPDKAGETDGLARIALRGGVSVGASQVVKIGLQFCSVVLLSRLLQPGDFGLVALVAPVIAFVGLFQNLGLQQAIVQRHEIADPMLTDMFWLTVLLGVVCAGAVVLAAPGVAWFFGDQRLVWLTTVSSIPVLVGSLTTLPQALLSRGMRFGVLAVVETLAAVAGFAVAISAAWLGAGYWALVAASLAATAATLAGTWTAARWLPGRPRARLLDRQMIVFGANLTGFGFVNFFARNLDNVLIGWKSGSVELGYYDRAYQLLMFPLQNINAPVARVMVPVLSRMQAEKPRLRAAYLRTVGQLTLLAVPGVAAVTVTSGDVVALLFGERWQAVGPIFAWLGVAGLVQPLNNSMGWIFIAQGRTQAMFRWGLYAAVTTILAFVAGLPWGAVGVAAAYTISDYVVRLPVLYVVVGRIGPVGVRDLVLIQGPLLLAAAATWLLVELGLRDWLGLGGASLIGAAVLLSYAVAVAAVALRPGGPALLRDSVGQARTVAAWLPGRRRAAGPGA